ncbi:MAG: hypothetical protein R2824_19780 [Saprospiraceae bacterium]|nr:hypothetical protein [Lewinella sp.]
MDKISEYIGQAEAYLSGELNKEQLTFFEQRIKLEPELKQLVEELKLLREGMGKSVRIKIEEQLRYIEKVHPSVDPDLETPPYKSNQGTNEKEENDKAVDQDFDKHLIEGLKAEVFGHLTSSMPAQKEKRKWLLPAIFIGLILTFLLYLIFSKPTFTQNQFQPVAENKVLFQAHFDIPDILKNPAIRRAGDEDRWGDIIKNISNQQYQQATEQLRVLEKETGDPMLMYYRGVILLGAIKPYEAIDAFDGYLEQNGPSVNSDYLYYYRALAYVLIGDRQAARQDLNRISPEASDIYESARDLLNSLEK